MYTRLVWALDRPPLVCKVPDPMTDDPSAGIVEDRKRQQMDLATGFQSAATWSAGWEDVHLVPRSLPETSFDEDVDLETEFLGHSLAAPLVIAGMTGGHEHAIPVNRMLGEAAQAFGLAIGVGSQRAALLDDRLAGTYRAVREGGPDVLILANVGVSQLVHQGTTPPFSIDDLQRAVEMVEAQALAIHLNVLEELIQTEGDRHTAGHIDAIANVVASMDLPVVAKETGAGLDRDTAERLVDAGVSAIDVGGLGGTSFAVIEALRAETAGDRRGERLGRTFADWGIPTTASILEVRSAGVPVIATGGVRSGLDIAKAIALGADLAGIGRPILAAALESRDLLWREIELLLEELAVAMTLCGTPSPHALKDHDLVITGFMRDWKDQRGLG